MHTLETALGGFAAAHLEPPMKPPRLRATLATASSCTAWRNELCGTTRHGALNERRRQLSDSQDRSGKLSTEFKGKPNDAAPCPHRHRD
jgi:hypothetical protein